MLNNNIPPALAPQIALLSSIIAYPVLFYLVTPRSATPSRFIKSREAISVLHCTFVTLASAYVLQSRHRDWDSNRLGGSLGKRNPAEPNISYGANSPLITTRSTLGNSITAFEMGYLVQDAVILILAARLRAQGLGRGRESLVKEINWRVLGWHHAGISTALGLLQWYIARGKEKGIMIILMLMFMNASLVDLFILSFVWDYVLTVSYRTPVGTLHWYLVNFQCAWRKLIMIANAVYLIMYGIFRVGVVYWILHVFGSQTGHSAIGAFWRLRTTCWLGTSTIGIANLIWFILGLRKFAGRYLTSDKLRKGQ